MARRRSRCSCRCMCRSFFLLVFLTTAALVSFDIYLHGSYAASNTREFIEEKGMMAAIKAAFVNVFYCFAKVWLWLIDHLPKILVELWHVSSPYRELLWNLLVEVGQWLVDITDAPRSWVRGTVRGILDWMEGLSPGVYGTISDFLGIIWEYLVWAVTSAFSAVIHYTILLATWVRDNVFVGMLSPENILLAIRDILSFIPNYIRTCVEGEDMIIDDDDLDGVDEDEVPKPTPTTVPPPTSRTPPPPAAKQQAPPPPVKQQTPPPPVKQQTPPPPMKQQTPPPPMKQQTPPPPVKQAPPPPVKQQTPPPKAPESTQPKQTPPPKVPDPEKKQEVPIPKETRRDRPVGNP